MDKLNFTKHFCSLNDIVKKTQSKPHREKILANYIFINDLYPEYINNSHKSIRR